MLKYRPGPVVTNLSTSKVVSDVAAEVGVPFHFAKVGEVNVAMAMRDVGATIGGEGNGGVILPELHLGRDAPCGCGITAAADAGRGAPVIRAGGRSSTVCNRQGQVGPSERRS